MQEPGGILGHDAALAQAQHTEAEAGRQALAPVERLREAPEAAIGAEQHPCVPACDHGSRSLAMALAAEVAEVQRVDEWNGHAIQRCEWRAAVVVDAAADAPAGDASPVSGSAAGRGYGLARQEGKQVRVEGLAARRPELLVKAAEPAQERPLGEALDSVASCLQIRAPTAASALPLAPPPRGLAAARLLASQPRPPQRLPPPPRPVSEPTPLRHSNGC
mmetsp:Transcript_8128/g.22060  ORF Transcript_8128/g.22060 Transcript_8128/m.22060 type:complete len:219 (+) Transcript_8128:712-1368(+)